MSMKVMNGLDLQGQRITALGSPSSATDAANKSYVDGLVQGLSWKSAVRAATTAAGTLSSSFANGSTIDGVTLATGDRILVKNQATGSENGIYVVASSGAPTRATDADAGSEIVNASVYVSEGTTLADTSWTCTTNAPITLGSTSLTWAQTNSGTSYSAGNGLSLSTNTFSVQANGTSLDVSASGVRIADSAAGNGLTLTSGVLAVGAGTGVTVAADAVSIDTSVVARKYSANIGDGSATSIAVTHSLGSKDVSVTVRDSATDAAVLVDWVATSTTVVTLTFAVAPASNAYRVTVIG